MSQSRQVRCFEYQWLFGDVMAGAQPLALRFYQRPPVMRLGVTRMETVGHVFLIRIFKSYKTPHQDFEHLILTADNEIHLDYFSSFLD